jgi:MFS transporter, DHA2 family, glioxin efflux transporter
MSTLDIERKEVEEPASDANTMVEKRENDTENESIQTLEAEVQLPEDQLSPDDYPKGFQFFFILLALILSIFMVALDLVYLP